MNNRIKTGIAALLLAITSVLAGGAIMQSMTAGAADYSSGTLTDATQVGVSAPSPNTLIVELVSPVAYFNDLVAMPPFYPVHVRTLQSLNDEDKDRYWKPAHIVTNGPYLLKEWRLNDRIRLEKNPRYWDAASVKLHTVDMLSMANPNTALNFFLTGAAMFIFTDRTYSSQVGSCTWSSWRM